jgi:K+-transporting ATPase A subunit
MEADIREQTDKAGFCRYHFQKMFDYGNTLGNAWIDLTRITLWLLLPISLLIALFFVRRRRRH